MISRYKDYIIEADPSTGRFDLYREQLVEKKDSKNFGKKAKYNIGYSFTRKGVVERIASLEMAKREGTMSMNEYDKEFKKIIKDVEKSDIAPENS